VRSNIDKAHAFAKHPADVFQLHPSENETEEEETLMQLLESLINSNHQSNASKQLKFKKSPVN
jgi:hypothetical protein